ncbi:MAG: peptidylprolyl isomerase [Methylococcales bacterium]|jgi:peptidyl-prolyl cis-trans isomerase C|nr:peptidylprolyl isomerase [Methylococcales bacterium]MBT7445726.1 peptidylprolyl isomerase [Methylococcales bacterium]
MKIRYLAIVITLLYGCNDDNNNGKEVKSLSGGNNLSSDFSDYLTFKHITVRDDAHRKALLAQFQEKEQLAKAIEQEGQYDKTMVSVELNEFRKEMLISRYFQTFLDREVTDASVQNYYISHANDYEQKRYHVAHILVRTTREMNEVDRQVKLTSINAANTLLKSGKPFSEVAKLHSEDQVSSKKGGDLGWLKPGAVAPSFSKVVASLEPGHFSKPFETVFGYHIVQLVEAATVVKQPLEAVQGNIKHQLRTQAKQTELDRLGVKK